MQNKPVPDGINTRAVLIAYAIAAPLSGTILFDWLTTSFLSAAACCAIGLATIDDPVARLRTLGWFAAAHCLVFAMALAPHAGSSEETLRWLFLTTTVLGYTWLRANGDPAPRALLGLFSRNESEARNLKSRWEQQIRAAAATEERSRLARELHDSVKQQIFVIQTAAATAQERFEGDQPGANQALTQVRDSAREAMSEMEAMMDSLTAAPLENTGLVAALKKQCEALGFRTGAQVDLKIGTLPDNNTLEPGVQQAVFRIAQEALANAGRHARARHVKVSLQSTGNQLELKISDDGAGYDQNQAGAGMGIRNMRTRADTLKGSLEITSQPGTGTAVRLTVPVNAAESLEHKSQEYRSKVLWNIAIVLVGGIAAVLNRRSAFIVVFLLGVMELIRYSVAWRRARIA